jgi:hypothetical protein
LDVRNEVDVIIIEDDMNKFASEIIYLLGDEIRELKLGTLPDC